MNSRVVFLAEVAIMSALSIILGLISFRGLWAQGGSVSLEMIPIFLMAFRRGLKGGLLTGIVVGLLQLLLNPIAGAHPVSILLDYPLAFMAAGFAGLFSVAPNATTKQRTKSIVFGIFFGSLLRLVCHYISGVVFFGSYAPDNMNPYIYSLLYNISYMIPVAMITLITFLFLTNTAPKILHGSNKGVSSAA